MRITVNGIDLYWSRRLRKWVTIPAIATEAGTAETVKQGSVHESPVGDSRCAQTQSGKEDER